MVCPSLKELQDKSRRLYNTKFVECTTEHAKTQYPYRSSFHPGEGHALSSSSEGDIEDWRKEMTKMRDNIVEEVFALLRDTYLKKIGSGEMLGLVKVVLRDPRKRGYTLVDREGLLAAVGDANQMNLKETKIAMCELMWGVHKVGREGNITKLTLIDQVLQGQSPPIVFANTPKDYGMISHIVTEKWKHLNRAIQHQMVTRLGWVLKKKKPKTTSTIISELTYSSGKAYVVKEESKSNRGAQGDTPSREVYDKQTFEELVSRNGPEEVGRWAQEILKKPLPAEVGTGVTTPEDVSQVTDASGVVQVSHMPAFGGVGLFPVLPLSVACVSL